MSEGVVARALRESLVSAPAAKEDRAAVQLARRYAGLLDQATPASRYRPLLDKVGAVLARSRDKEAVEALEKIRDALGAHSVLSDLGPKYLAVLVALGLTPSARGDRAAPAGAGTPTPNSKADELRIRRDQRRQRAGPNPR